MKSKPIVRLVFVDFPGPANPDAITEFLSDRYEVIVDDQDPDFVFYSVFGYKFLDYNDAVRIFYTGENVHADFNLCDFAFGFDWMDFEDRYYRSPNFLLYQEFKELRNRGATPTAETDRVVSRPRFCNFIYSNAKAHPYREELFHALSDYQKIDAAGVLLNNTGFLRGSPSLGIDATRDKLAFQRECKFSIAIENSSSPGYTTEKLVHALAADTIPIYWGDPNVDRDFNSERIINCHDFDSMEDVIKRIKEINEDDNLFRNIVSKPFFPHGKVPDGLRDDLLSARFSEIFEGGRVGSRRRNRHVWGKIYEERRRQEVAVPTFRSVASSQLGSYNKKAAMLFRRLKNKLTGG